MQRSQKARNSFLERECKLTCFQDHLIIFDDCVLLFSFLSFQDAHRNLAHGMRANTLLSGLHLLGLVSEQVRI